MNLSYAPYTLKFVHPFTIAAGTRDSTPVVFTRISHDGHTGLGEASMPPYLGESHDSVMRFLKKASPVIASWKDPHNIAGLMEKVDNIQKGNAAAKASIDIALHDLSGKLQDKPCYRMFNIDKSKAPFSSFTIGIDADMKVIAQKVKESGDFRILKVKLGMDNDKQMIEAVRSATDKAISVDANQGWKDKHFALDMIHWLKERDVLFVEQPMPKESIDDAAWLAEHSPLPVIADEAVQRYEDIDRVKHAYHGINIKLMKCTGMNEAFKMIGRARELNMKVLIGCMSESSCAVSAAAQLSPLCDWADLDGPYLIANDPFDGMKIIDGRVTLNDMTGIGVTKR
jgi:L-alanine-DL-glutamate epimerase-like enolase superfamily enzyme